MGHFFVDSVRYQVLDCHSASSSFDLRAFWVEGLLGYSLLLQILIGSIVVRHFL